MKIEWVKFGEISINGKVYYSDVIAYWDGDVELRQKSHVLGHNEFLRLARKEPDMIIIGTGFKDFLVIKIPEEVEDLAKQKKIEIFVEDSIKASEIFSALVNDGKKAIAVIHTTC
jgi:hypothetical protein